MRGLLILFAVALSCCAPAWADITVTGQVGPPDPSTWTEETGVLVGNDSFGSVRIDNGTQLISDSVILGGDMGSRGEVTITDPGSSWTSAGPTVLGIYGEALLSVEAGGAFHANEQIFFIAGLNRGDIRVDGAGSTLTAPGGFRLAGGDTGTLSITGGASVVSNNQTRIGEGATGLVLVQGAGSTFEANLLGVGSNTSGVLDVTQGGRLVTTGSSRISASSMSHGRVTIDGPGSIWTTEHRVLVADRGDGGLVIQNGGRLENHFTTIAPQPGSRGGVSVRGAGSAWVNAGSIHLGAEGDGAISVTDGALLAIGKLTSEHDPDPSPGDVLFINASESDYVNVTSGGRLAFWGDVDTSINAFLTHTSEPAAIRYFDNDLYAWAPITDAVRGEDYWLSYRTEGELAGYTVLTVGYVPEPATFGIAFLCSGLCFVHRRR